MPNKIASLLETTIVFTTLMAGVVFSYGSIGASYFPAPPVQANVAAAATLSGVAARGAAEAKVHRINANVCAENNCGVDQESILRESAEEKTSKF